MMATPKQMTLAKLMPAICFPVTELMVDVAGERRLGFGIDGHGI